MGPLLLEQKYQVEIARIGWRGDADERDLRGPGGARIVDGVAHVNELGAGILARDAQQSIGRGLGILDVFHGDDRVEGEAAGKARERERGFLARAAGEDRQAELFA